MITLTEMTLVHAYELARTMREGDRLECEALGHTPRQSMRKCYYESMIKKTVLVDGQVAACYGATGTILGPILHPWLLTAKIVDKVYLPLAVLYREQVKEWLSDYPRLENFCHAEYTKSLNLLRLVGFTVEKPLPHGPRSKLFCRFHKGVRMPIRIEQVRATDHLEEAWKLLEMHRDELATNKELMVLKPNIEKYRQMQKSGNLFALALYDDDKLVGYSVVIVVQALHYADLKMAQNDILYVHPDYRKSFWGLKLIRETERLAKEQGAQMITWHGKEKTTFSELMPKLGYRVQDILFSKEL